jgi:hypothetical protein
MLPLTVQFLIAMLAFGLNERMARKADYPREENRVLKEALRVATGKNRIPLTNEQRQRLATKGRALTPAERQQCCQIVRPSTILAWFRQLVARKYDSSRVRRPGRPRKASRPGPYLPAKPAAEEGAEGTSRGLVRIVTHRPRHPNAVPVENGRAHVYPDTENTSYLGIRVV